ncbi:MAG: hypothetical protein HOB82_01255 [Alphaproteobacteria bacterium]|nr:hypothetical protein [Alphaproteobacteria bacterium]
MELAKGEADHQYLVPSASDEADYVAAHKRIAAKHDADVLIANSDVEVAVWSRHREDIPCKHLIPDPQVVAGVQDKFEFSQLLKRHGCDTVPNAPITSIDLIPDALAEIPAGEKFWIRRRGGSGSVGATWLTSADQAKKWLELWQEMRGFQADEFVVAPFLPGRDFCVATLWQNGEFAVGKIYERLTYWGAQGSLSSMGSSPDCARTVAETWPIEQAKKAIQAVCSEFGTQPHGFYQADLKCADDKTALVTEINIGRFPQTSTHFDRVGEYRMLELYLQLILDPGQNLPRDVLDVVADRFVLRGIDMPVKLVDKATLDAFEENRI